MRSKENLSEDARLHAKDAAQRARPWIEWFARWGYATEGAVYTLIGLLATHAAFALADTLPASGAPSESLEEVLSAASCWV